jgi:hypothetical protein
VNVAEFAEFWRRQGIRVLSSESCFWYEAQPWSFLSLPYHRALTPTARELRKVLLLGPAAVVRFPATPAEGKDANGALFVCRDRNYGIQSLQPRTRSMTRRGLEQCEIKRLGFQELERLGYPLNADTLTRQGRESGAMSERRWSKYCRAAEQTPGMEGWCAYCDGEIASCVVLALVEDCLTILHQCSLSKHLERYPNNALMFTVTQQGLQRADVGYVSYGLRSLDDTPGLNRFKVHMGYTVEPFQERIEVHPVAALALRMGGNGFINWVSSRRPESDFWRKASKILRLWNDSSPRFFYRT